MLDSEITEIPPKKSFKDSPELQNYTVNLHCLLCRISNFNGPLVIIMSDFISII